MENFYEENKSIIDACLARIAEESKKEDEERLRALREKEAMLDNMTIEERIEYEDSMSIKSFVTYSLLAEDRKPFIDEVVRNTCLSIERVESIIKKIDFEKHIDRRFKSKFVDDINNAFPGAITNSSDVVPGYTVDLYYEKFKTAIDIVCSYEKDVVRVGKKYAQTKTLAANAAGVRLIHIFDYELLDEVIKTRVYRMLDDLLNPPKIIAGARHTDIKLIEYSDARDFLNLYHIQGAATANVYIGCYYGGELVGVMTFGKPRFSKGYDYEIVRLAWKTGVRISGGTKKMFNYFIKNFNPEDIMTYADINKFTGNSYLKLGYKFIQVTDPDYKWVSPDSTIALTRYKCQKHRLIEKGWGTASQTEDQIMMNHMYAKVYGSGNIMLDWVKGRKVEAKPNKVEVETKVAKASITKNTKSSEKFSLDNFI